MGDNIFFDLSRLKSLGSNVIIGKTVRIRYPELVEIGDNVIIDDFTYISTALKLHDNVHISAGCKIIGGKDAFVEMHEFSTLAPNVVLSAGSDDYLSGIATPLVPRRYKGNVKIGTITLHKHCIAGAGSVVLPDVVFEEGACLGALSLANKTLSAYTLYGGIPARKLKQRNEEEIKTLEQKFRNEQ
jgi:acetyltransferase-like isoleucine patch superfamily enzyme